jgi:16S rRNA processing protein RimM
MRVVVGRIGRAQGIGGEVTVEVRTDSPEERFSPGAVLFLESHPGQSREVTVVGTRWQGGRLVLRIAGVDDRTGAEALRGGLLEAEVDITDADDEEYHDAALRGLAVRDVAGVEIGSVADVLHLPGQDLLAVHRPGAAELLVPFVHQMVPEVDIAGGYLVVDLPEGLADLGAP